MFRSDSLVELSKALAKAQGEIKNAKKDTDNPFFKSKYADLAGIWDACRPQLSANGLTVVQLPRTTTEGKLALEYVLLHTSGEFIGESVDCNPVKNDPQGHIAAITYYRRTTLASLVGVATEDDDGNGASGKGNDELITPDQVKDLETAIADVNGNLNGFLDYMGVKALKDIRKSEWHKAYAAIESKRKRK